MKMKRWISALLTLALCLGLLPGAALATEEEAESNLPEGYEQMYVGGNDRYVTIAEGTAGVGGDIWLYGDANGATKLNTTTTNSDNETVYENYNITCDESIGEMGFGKNGTNWRKENVKPGAEGYIYAEPVSGSGTKYAIKVKINGNPNVIYDDKGNSKFTISAGKAQAFTFPPTIYVDGVSKRLTKDDFNGETYTFTCDSTVGTLYWHETYDELAINTTTATWGASGNITITNKADNTKVYTCAVTANAPKLPFKIYDAATEGNEIAATTVGTYSIEYPLGEDKTVYLRMNDGETVVFTDAPFYSSTKTENNEELVFVSSELQSDGKVMAVTFYGTRTTSTTQTDPVKVGDDVYTITLTFTPENEIGVYTTLTGRKLSDTLIEEKVYGDEGPTGYKVAYTSGQSVTVYCYHPNRTYTCSSDDVAFTAVEGMTGVYAVTLPANKTGTISAVITWPTSDGNGSFPIVFSDGTTGGDGNTGNTESGGNNQGSSSDDQSGLPAGYAQMYFEFTDNAYATDIELSLGGSAVLNGKLFADANGTTVIDLSSCTLSFSKDGLGSIVNPPDADGNRIWVTDNVTAEAGGYLYAVNTSDSSVKYAIAVSVTEQSGPPSGGNEGDSPFYTLVSEKRALAEADKVGDNFGESGPVAFEYSGKTYYLCTMLPRTEEEGTYRMNYAGGVGEKYREGASFQSEYCIGIWTANATKDTYTLIEGDEKDALLAAFESWSVTAYHAPDHHILDGYPATAYPEVYRWKDENGWPCGTMFKHYEDGLGSWWYAFTGKMEDGTTVTTYAKNGFHFIYDSLEYTATSIADANAKLQEWKNMGASLETDYQINLPAGELEGILVVPGGMEFVDINGSTSGKRTVLRGGIAGEGHVMVHDIDFIGCGWWATNWPNDDVYGGAPNYGLYAEGGGQYKDCTFKNYFHALHCGPTQTMGRIIFGGTGTLFENNFIALYLNSTMNGGGDLQMTENVFRYNGCALWMENKGNRFSLNDYHLTRCEFYDNGWDVINLMNRCYFLPGQLFERDNEYGHGKFAGRRDALITPPTENAPQNASKAAADVSEQGSGVYTFPVAKDDKFKDFDYTNKDAVIGNHNASSWLIPEKDLDGKTITVIQDEKGEDAVIWSFGEENK